MANRAEPLKLVQQTNPPKQYRGRDAVRFGQDQHGRIATFVVCGKCGESEGAIIPLEAPPLALDQYFGEKRRWDIVGSGRKATCPKCHARPQPPGPPPAASRLLYQLLEAHLRVEGKSGEYAPGWSDARIAELAGVEVQAVRAARREGFAPHLLDRAREEMLATVNNYKISVLAEIDELDGFLRQTRKDMIRKFDELRAQLTGEAP